MCQCPFRHRFLVVVALFASLVVFAGHSPAAAGELGSATLQIAGTRLSVSPVGQTVPFDTATLVETHLEGYDPGLGTLPANLRVLGDFSGPGIEGVVTLATTPNEPFRIPRLRVKGAYALANIRLVQGGELLGYAEPRSVSVNATQILITKVSARPLTQDEMNAYGIIVDDTSYQTLNMTFGFAVNGREFDYNMPVVYHLYDTDGEWGVPVNEIRLPDMIGGTVDNPRFKPPMMVPFKLDLGPEALAEEVPNGGCDIRDAQCRPEEPPAPPMVGVILFPTELSLLHQFFSVVLTVQNGAPEGDELPFAELYPLGAGAALGMVARPEAGGYEARLRRTSGSGSFSFELILPADGPEDELTRYRWDNVSLPAGAAAKVVFDAATAGAALEIDDDGDGLADRDALPGISPLARRPFEVVKARQEFGVDPSAHVVELLFSADIDLATLVPRDPDHFRIDGLVSNGGLTPQEASISAGIFGGEEIENPLEGLFNPRVVRVVFNNPILPGSETLLTVSGLRDSAGRDIGEHEVLVEPGEGAQPGAAVAGRVIDPYGQALPNAEVSLFEWDLSGIGGDAECARHRTARVRASDSRTEGTPETQITRYAYDSETNTFLRRRFSVSLGAAPTEQSEELATGLCVGQIKPRKKRALRWNEPINTS